MSKKEAPEVAPAPSEKSVKSGCCSKANPDDLYGMVKDERRKVRDCFCCVLFILFWAGMLAIGGIGIHYGKWQRMVYGTDYKGRVCGVDDGVSDAKYVSYPRTNEDFIANLGKSNPLDFKFYGVCTSSCPKALETICNDIGKSHTEENIEGCFHTPDFVPDGIADCDEILENCWINPQETSSILFRCIPSYNVTQSGNTVCTYPTAITDPLDPRCVVVTDFTQGSVQRPAKTNLLFDQLNSAQQVWGRWFGDLARSWWAILAIAVGLALVFGFIYVTVMKYATGFMVWLVIWLVLLVLSSLTGFFYYKAGLINLDEINPSLADKIAALSNSTSEIVTEATAFVPQEWENSAEDSALSYEVMAYVSTAVTVIVFCLVIALRKSIRTAIEVIKIGSDALRDNPLLLVFPIGNVIAIGLFMVYWVFVAASLASAGEITTANLADDVNKGLAAVNELSGTNLSTTDLTEALGNMNVSIASVENMPIMNYLIIYHIFGLLWTSSFIQGVACLTVAGVVCGWYFSQLPEGVKDLPEYEKKRYTQPKHAIWSSLKRTLKFYLGSVAFGSLLIAIIQAIRLVFAYIQKQLEPQAQNSKQLRYILCCIQCCLACVQKAVEVVTRNAYIFIALKGESFCSSGGRVFGLIRKHGGVFVVVNTLGEIIMFLGKVLISTGCAWVQYAVLDNVEMFQPGGSNEISSSWLPVLVTLFFSYFIAAGFMIIYDLAVDAVLVCYCTDTDENNGSPIHFDKGKLDAEAKANSKKVPTLSSEETSTKNVAAGVAPKV